MEKKKNVSQSFLENENKINVISEDENVHTENPEEIIKEYTEEKKTRKKRKSKVVDTEETEAQKGFTQSAVFSAHVGLNLIIARLPKNIPLTPEESQAFDEAFTNLAKKYYSSIQRFSEEVNFVLILGLLIVPRLDFDKFNFASGEVKKENTKSENNGTK